MLWSLKVTWYMLVFGSSRAFHTQLGSQDKCPFSKSRQRRAKKEAGSTFRATGSYLILSTLSSSKVFEFHRRNELGEMLPVLVVVVLDDLIETEEKVTAIKTLWQRPQGMKG